MNKLNVAIADDNERVIQSLSEVIEKDENMHLIGKSTNGKDFYELIKQKQPDVVLVDLIMPKLDGLMVIHKVNQDETIKKKPEFIVMSAAGSERLTEDAFRQGASYYLMKPLDYTTITSQIRNVMEPARRPDARKHFSGETKEEYMERNLENEYWEGAYHDVFTYDKMRFEANELTQLLLLFIDRVALNQENCWSIFKHIRSLPSPGIIDEEDLEFFQKIKLLPPKD